MDALNEILDQLIFETPREVMSQAERDARSIAITALFSRWGRLDGSDASLRLADQYIIDTDEIPFTVLILAIKGLVRAYPYPSLPLTANIFTAAFHIAGMDREQYRAGYYLPPNKQWPPEGKRHAIEARSYEHLPKVSVGLLNDPGRAKGFLGTGKE